MNSCTTFPLLLVVFNLFVSNLTAIFTMVWTLFNVKLLLLVLTTDCLFVILNCVVQGMMAHAGSSTTQEAEEIAVIVSKIVNNPSCKESNRKVFKNFLVQNQYRKLEFQNEFFVINWKLLLAVTWPKEIFTNNVIKLSFHYRCTRRQPRTWSSPVNSKLQSKTFNLIKIVNQVDCDRRGIIFFLSKIKLLSVWSKRWTSIDGF